MVEIDQAEMDALIASGGDNQRWPLRFDCNKRIFPAPQNNAEIIWYDNQNKN
jgi:hypothetical protein